MSRFQIIMLAIFVLFIIIGVAAFATYKGSNTNDQLPAITIWGTFPDDVFEQYVSTINNTSQHSISIKYTQKSTDQFSNDFIAALARGTGPDAILISGDFLLPHEDKLALVPYSALSARSFKDSYIQEADIYLSANGILGLPFSVDPLIMYWNRDMFDAAGVAVYPHYWDEFSPLNAKLTLKDQNGNIRKSAVALGDFTNVDNAREIFGTLLLQLGNPITIQASDGSVMSTIKTSAAVDPIPAIQFFTKFTNPADPNYSWNRSLPHSQAAFLSGTLATYFGFASELKDLRAKNPNLNFDAALIPQLRSGGVKATYGRLYGLSIVRSSPNPNAVYQILSILTAPQYISGLSQSLYLPNVRRDVIASGSNDPYISIFDQAALVASGWLDVDPSQSKQIFGNMIEAVTSGQKNVYQALQDAGNIYDQALRQVMP